MAARKQLSRLQPITPGRILDPDSERWHRNHDERIKQLQDSPLMQGRTFRNIVLPDNQLVLIPHGLGRDVVAIFSAPHRTFGATGRLSLVRDENPDLSKFVAAKAVGWTATITIDVVVF